MTLDPETCRRLAAECREDNARQPPGPWRTGMPGGVFGGRLMESGEGGVVAMANGDIQEAIARTRNNLAAIASALTAAAEMVERHEKLEASCNSAWAQVEVVTKERDAARAEVERLRAELVLRPRSRVSVDSVPSGWVCPTCKDPKCGDV